VASGQRKIEVSEKIQRIDATRRFARTGLIVSILLIAGGYLSAFTPGGAPSWAPWLLALGIPGALGSIMALGAARGRAGIGKLKAPFAFVFIVLTAGFCMALGLPDETAASTLWLGLPLRAAIIIYGIGLMPIVVLPVAYALTFDTQTLSQSDIDRVRQLAREISDAKAKTGEAA
jgi:hypothetical protein